MHNITVAIIKWQLHVSATK